MAVFNEYDETLEQVAAATTKPTTGNPYRDDILEERQQTGVRPDISLRAPVPPPKTGQPIPKPVNPYREDILEERAGIAARLAAQLGAAPELAPDQAKTILDIARRYGLPPEFVQRDLEHYQSLDKRGTERLVRESPSLAQWLEQQDQTTLAAVKADLANLSGIEGTVRAFGQNLTTGAFFRMGAGAWGMIRQAAETFDVGARIREGLRGSAAAPFFMHGPSGIGAQVGQSEVVPTVLGRVAEFASGASRTASVQAELAADESRLTPTERAVAMAGQSIGMMAMLGPFGSTGVLTGFFATTSGEEYQQYRESGGGVYAGAGYASVQGAIEVITEKMPLKYMEDIFKGKGFVDRVWRLYASEIGGEQAAAALQGLNTYYSIEANQGKTWDQFLQEQKGRQYEALVASVVTSTLMGGMSRLAAKATDHANRIAQQSKTIEHLPHLAQQALEASMAGKKVFIDLATFTEFFQSKGIDPAAMALKATGSPQAWDDAQQTHEPIELPLSGYFTHIGSKAEYNQLGQELRHHSPTAATAKEEAAVAETLDAGVAEVPGTAVAPIAEGATAAPRPIYDAALAEFTAKREATAENQQTTGGQVPVSVAKHYATLIEQGFTALARPLGLDPVKLYQAYGLKVTRETAAGLRQAATARQLIDPETGQPFETTPTLLGRVFETARAAVAKVGAALGVPQVAIPEAGAQVEQPAWHGSPHIFDKFSLHKIGSGEGAQAYGWGLYFASKKEVAESYQHSLGDYRIDGEKVDWNNPKHVALVQLHLSGGDIAKASDRLYRDAHHGVSAALPSVARQASDILGSILDTAGRSTIKRNDAVAALGKFTKGRLYKVDIPEDEDYLDWDKPLSQQSEKVRTALKELSLPQKRLEDMTREEMLDTLKYIDRNGTYTDADTKSEGMSPLTREEAIELLRDDEAYLFGGLALDDMDPETATGQSMYLRLSAAFGGAAGADRTSKFGGRYAGRGQEGASQALASVGIPGLRYLDGLSRQRGKGSHNYVLFDDRLIQITEFYQTTKQTETPAFKAWFGDSKVVDASGQPLVVYHGTSDLISAFDVKSGADTSGYGIPAAFFTDDPSVAASYAFQRQTLAEKKDVVALEKAHGEYDAAISDVWSRIKDHDDAMYPPQRAENRWGWMHDMFDRGVIDKATHAELTRLADAATESEDFSGPLPWEEGFNADARPNTVPVYLSLKNPKIVDANGMGWEIVMATVMPTIDQTRYDGAIFKNVRDAGDERESSSTVYVAFRPEQIKSAIGNRGTFDPNDPNILFSAADGEARAALRIDDQMLARTMVLFKSADRSSSLHELGHLFLDVFADVAHEIQQRDPATLAPEAIRQRDDFQQFLTWSGFTGSIQDWQALSVDEKRPHHEQFAEAWESYLRSGKAPSKALKGAFAAFRRWLMRLAAFLQTRLEFSPEMRDVVDRMLASDEAIQQVLIETDVQPMIRSAAEAEALGLTKAQYATYAAAIAQLPVDAQQALDARLFQELAREDTAEWKARRAELQQVVEADVHAEPVYQALSAMTRGTTPAGDTIGPPMPINRQALVALGLDVTRLPKGVTTTEGGLTPDQAAEAFGYDSPAALVAAVEAAEPMGRKIARETKARMLEDQGSMLLDGRLKPEAQAAVVNDSAETAVHTELSALHAQARKVSPARAVRTGIPSLDFFRREAAARLKRMVVGKINPQTFFVTARQQSKIALDEGVRGNVEAAIAAKNRELLNMALFRQSMALQKEVDKRVTFATKQATPKQQAKFGLVGEDFQNNINAILAKYQLAPIAALAKGARQADLAAFQQKLLNTPLPADLPQALHIIPATPYEQLTVQEFLDVTDGLTQIAHLALKENRAIKIANKAVLDDIRLDFAAHIALKTPPKSGRVHEVSEADKRRIRVASWFATHTKLSQFFYELDGSETGGMAFDLFGRPLNEADDWQRDRNTVEAKRYAAILDAHYTRAERGRFTEKMVIPGTDFSLSKEARIAIVLNMGNEGNYARLQTDPARRYSPFELRQILDTLDARDTQFVQATWDYLESFWPEVAAKEKRLTGLEPVKVQARAVETRHGTLKGGYYPIAYDAHLSARQVQFDIAEDGKLTAAAGYGRMMTERGHTETRLATVSMPLILELTVVGQHVDQVVHDLAFHETLIDVSRVLNSRTVEDAITASHGPLMYTEIVAAVRDIAQGYIPARTPVDRLFSWMKTGSQVAAMAYNAWTAAQQPLGNANTLGVLGAGNYHYYFKGLARFGQNASSQEGTLAWIRSNSAFMRQRESNLNQEMADLREAFRSQSGWFNQALLAVTGHRLTQQHLADSFMWHIGKAQLLADIPAWLAGYEMAMDRMRQQGPAAIDEAKAFALADQMVLDSQGGGSIKDMSQIQRGGPVLRAWLTFYSYSNLVFNQTRRIAGRTDWADPSQVTKAMSDLSLVYIAPAIGTTILAAITKGIWPGDDDDEDESKVDDWVWAIASESMGTAMGTMAIARDLSTVTKQLLTDDSSVRGVEGPAGTRILTELGKAAIQAEQGEVDEGLVKALNNVAGTVFRYPAVQAQRTANGFAAIIDGRTKNPLALIFGAPKEGAR